MDIRQGGVVYGTAVFVAGIVGSGDIGEDKNAWRPCALRAEEGGEGW